MKTQKKLAAILTMIFSFVTFSLLSGCNGGDGGGATVDGSISGTAVKGPVNGATVTAFAVNSGTMGAEITHGTTDAQGNFTLAIGNYSGSVMLQMGGGAYTDEATGAAMAMAPGDVMTAAISSVFSGDALTGIQMTPLTSIAQAMAHNMDGGLTPTNIANANMAIGSYFMVSDILTTQPINPLLAGSGAGATQDMINYGMSMAAMSQEAENLGLSSSSSMVTAMMNDASDGVMNGMMGGTGVTMGGMTGGGVMMQATAGTSDLANAMITFMSSTLNQSGLTATEMETLINQLTVSNGTIQSGAIASGMIGGAAFNGTLNNAMVTAYAITDGVMGAQLGSAATNTLGDYLLPVGTYSGPVMLQVSGGTYMDLATGTTMTMATGNVMTAVIPEMSSGAAMTDIAITPLTSMAQARAQSMTGGMTAENATTVNSDVGNYFMVFDILHSQPMNPALPGSGAGATQDMRNYGISVAAMSQYALTIGMTNSSAMISAMMNDASDGTMNGMMGDTGVQMGGGMMGGNMMQATAGTSDLATAMTNFMGSATNQSGLTATNMLTLINQLAASSGTL
jgi:hypothetical protein